MLRRFWGWLADMFGWDASWKEIRRWWSMWLMGLNALIVALAEVVPQVWAEMPVELRDMIPDNLFPWLMLSMAVLPILARPMRQGSRRL